MKKKLFIAIATGVFMIAMMVNLSIAQMNNSGNQYLKNIKIMTSAVAESSSGDCSTCGTGKSTCTITCNGVTTSCSNVKGIEVVD